MPAEPSASSRAARRCGRAFTLLEMLLVIALLSAVVAFAWPSLGGAAQGERLLESGRRVRALVAMCRAEAMNQGVRYRLKIRRDGTLRVQRQAHPVRAPHLYAAPRADWVASHVALFEDVWVESVQLLPEGPPPIRIIDEKLEFPELEFELVPVEELDPPLALDFEPDGTSPSLRCILRDRDGFALLVTIDGRLGRVTVGDWPKISRDELRVPEPLDPEEDPDDEFDPEDFR